MLEICHLCLFKSQQFLKIVGFFCEIWKGFALALGTVD